MAFGNVEQIRGFMGIVHAELRLTNFFTGQSTQVRALVDTGATEMTVTPEVAVALGFDLEEVWRQMVTVADGRRFKVPRIGPLQIRYQDRAASFDAMVMGDQCLMGQVPLEVLDLIVDPKEKRLIGRDPDGPVSRV